MTDLDEATEKLIGDMINAINKNIGAPCDAVIAALSSITARAIRLYAAEDSAAGREDLLAAFIAAVEDCMAQDDEKEEPGTSIEDLEDGSA